MQKRRPLAIFGVMQLQGRTGRANGAAVGRNDKKPLVEFVYQALLEQIFSGKMPSGTTISELSLSEQLGVSRTPVHDAVRQLAKDGLVVRETGRRAKVAAFSSDDIFEIFEIRKYLEGPAIELAAGRMDVRQLAPLRLTAEGLHDDLDAPDWVARWAEFDDLFHMTIARASGNRRLTADINRYRLLHKGVNRISTDSESLQRALGEHLEIIAALEGRDSQLARERMVAHIANWQQFFVSRLCR